MRVLLAPWDAGDETDDPSEQNSVGKDLDAGGMAVGGDLSEALGE